MDGSRVEIAAPIILIADRNWKPVQLLSPATVLERKQLAATGCNSLQLPLKLSPHCKLAA
jgi:hypothetical protein